LEEVQSRVIGDNPELAEQLATAAAEAGRGDYSVAYLTYRQALNNNVQLYDDTFVHTVAEGEYLTMIARRFNTTIQAIVQANDLLDPNRIIAGQDLVIPRLTP
jgi:LysM repeat protein